MARMLVAFMLLSSASLIAQKYPAHYPPNPDDYTINVHVQSSRLVIQCGGQGCVHVQQLSVAIQGRTYELELDPVHFSTSLLRTGDYKAKALNKISKHAYEYERYYEFLFPDGERRKYLVIGASE